MGLSRIDRRIIGLGLPALGTLAVEPLYRLVDTAIIGRLGTDELAGLAVAAAVLALIIAGSNFLTYGTTERVARRLAANDPSSAADVGVQAIWLAMLVAAVAAPIVGLAASPLVRALGASGAAAGHATTYLQISALGIPCVLFALAAQGTQRGAADFRTPLVILVCSNVINVILAPTMVLGFDMGIAGAAWSTVIAQFAAAVAFAFAVRARLAPAVHRRPSWTQMAPLVTAGKHLLLRVGSMMAVFTGATAIAARIDDDTLAAHQVAMTMFTFLALVLDALSVPAQTLVADDLGRAGGEAPLIARRVTVLSLAASAIIAAVLAAAAPWLPRVFSTDGDVRSAATTALLLLAVALLPGAVAFAGDGILIGAGDYRFLGRAAFGYLVAVIPIAVVVLASPSLGIAGIWMGLVVWMCLRAVVNSRRVHHVVGPVQGSGVVGGL